MGSVVAGRYLAMWAACSRVSTSSCNGAGGTAVASTMPSMISLIFFPPPLTLCVQSVFSLFSLCIFFFFFFVLLSRNFLLMESSF